MRHRPRTALCRTTLLAVLILLAPASGALAQEPPRTGLDAPKIRVAVADFIAIGGARTEAGKLSDSLRKALAAHPQVTVVAGQEVRREVADAEAHALAGEPGVARKLGDKIGVDAVIYGRLVTDVSGILDDALVLPNPIAQLSVVETLSLEGEIHPGRPIAAPPGAEVGPKLLASAISLLPAMGRVLSIIDSPEGVSIQLFPVGGRVLATGAQYGIYNPVAFGVPIQDAAGRSDALARQQLRTGALTGRVLTATKADGHAIEAASVDPRGRIAVGQLVGLPPARDDGGPGQTLPVLLVNAAPADCVVSLDGKVVGVTPVAVPFDPGQRRTVAIARRDYHTSRYEVTAEETDALAMSVALKEIPPFGSLKIATTPQGAIASLNGVEVGKTPLDRDQVPSGDHRLTLALPGYKPVARDISVKRQRTVELALELEKDLRKASIRSVPQGGRVFIDGDEAGVTPLDLRAIQTGEHALKITIAGHAILNETFNVKPTDDEQVFSYRMRALAGNVRVETTPPGAAVSVDGEIKGNTPIALTGLSIGQHKLTIEADGYLPFGKTIEVQDQQTSVVQEALTRAEGQLICISVPAGATIILDGEEQGVTPRTLTGVPVGKRGLILKLDGYQTWTARAPIFHGETTKVEVGLIRIEPGLRRQP